MKRYPDFISRECEIMQLAALWQYVGAGAVTFKCAPQFNDTDEMRWKDESRSLCSSHVVIASECPQ